MRTNVALGILALATCVPGCELTRLTVESLVYESVYRLDDCCQHTRNCLLARATWNRYRKANPETSFSDDFAEGFQDGFADYIYYGGAVDAPPVPPPAYWKYRHQLPDKDRLIHEWQEGYRTGATLAQATGYREGVVVPVVTPIPPGTPRVPGSLPPPLMPVPALVDPRPPSGEDLPPPRPLPPAGENPAPPPAPPAPATPAPAPAALPQPVPDAAQSGSARRVPAPVTRYLDA